MEENFQELIQRIIREQGRWILERPAQCRGLLSDYAKGRYKREIRLLLIALEGCYQGVRDSRDLAGDMPRFFRALTEGYGVSSAEAEEAVNLLLEIFDGIGPDADGETAQAIEALEKAALKGDYRAMYDLGLLLEKLNWYEESNYWFKKAAKQGLLLFERYLQVSDAPAGKENSENQEKLGKKAEGKKENAEKVTENAEKTEKKAEEKKENAGKIEKKAKIKKEPDGKKEKFAEIPGGTFIMGSSGAELGRSADEVQHQVRVSGFFLGKYAVTQGEYRAITGTNPSLFSGDTLPVENVTWFEAAAYCNALSLMEKRTPAYILRRDAAVWDTRADGYRLPTEAEWEYACRAGTGSPFCTGRRLGADQANYNGTGDAPPGVFRRRTIAVGSFPPNRWGLYDMHGNVYEWCWDWYAAYPITVQSDPAGPVLGEERVIRGGSWNYPAKSLRSAARSHDAPNRRSGSLGFRLLLPMPRPET
jgi:formylglycine-generating enzyme required for sulfatase activity